LNHYFLFIIYFDGGDLIGSMLELNMLILTALTLFVVSLFMLFYLYVTKSKELDRLKQVLQATIKRITPSHHGCPHHLGYLHSYPSNKPIPNECMGCSEVIECVDKKLKSTPSKEKAMDRKTAKQKTVKARKQEKTKKETTSSTKAKTSTKRTTRKKKLARKQKVM